MAKEAGYWPYYKTVESASTPRLTIEGHDCINFGSNNYLSLSYHPRVVEAARDATSYFGSGVTGSRLLNGTLTLHCQLEEELADFYGREAALVFSTGYVANMSAIAAFLTRHDYAIADKEIHNSLLTGVRLAGATMKRFRHNDVGHLERALATAPAEAAKGVIVDGVYSMGGDTAPLDEMVELCRRFPNTFLLDDEAHGLRVLRDEPERVVHLHENVALFLGLLAERGVPTNPAESAIVTIPLKRPDEVSTVLVALDLLEQGVFVNPVIPPAVTTEVGLIRLSLMADHSPELLEEATETLFKVLGDHDQLPDRP